MVQELKKTNQETEQAQQNMRHELRQLEDNKKKVRKLFVIFEHLVSFLCN